MSSTMSVAKIVETMKANGDDYEWYPTQSDMIDCIRANIRKTFEISKENEVCKSILDCGCGDGRVLKGLTAGPKYGIEKSKTLLDILDSDIFIVGTEFTSQTLLDKKTDILFSNPPYKSYLLWTIKIVNECCAPYAYLIIPQRWKDNLDIKLALENRKASAEVIGEFDFLEADRKARAKVDIVKITFCHKSSERYYRSDRNPQVDPFEAWFKENFPFNVVKSRTDTADLKVKLDKIEEKSNGIVKREGLATILEKLYQRDLDKLMNNYLKLRELDAEVLGELGIKPDEVCSALKLKIDNLKDKYWRELFDNLEAITERLTKSSRESMLNVLLANTHVDFSSDNAQAIVLWAIKNANKYFDSQFIETFEMMVEKASVVNYKSNATTFGTDGWRYSRYEMREKLSHYKLDYRFVLEGVGGISSSDWRYDSVNGLSNRAANFINDLLVCAKNIGFDTKGLDTAKDYNWYSNKSNNFYYRDLETGDLKVLFECKAFKNGNLHCKFNPDFMCRMNVEFGRLKGWVKSPREAADEMDIDFEVAAKSFDSTLKLGKSDVPLLTRVA